MKVPMNRLSMLCPSVWEHALVGLVTFLILEQHSRFPEVGVWVLFAILLLLALLGFLAFVRFLICFWETPNPEEKQYRSRASCLVIPVAVFLVITSSATHWPASLRFALSRSSFEKLVAEAQTGVEPQGFPRRVGLYWIHRIYDDEFDYQKRTGKIGFITGTALLDPCGLNYDPTDYDPSHFLTKRIAANWFLTELD